MSKTTFWLAVGLGILAPVVLPAQGGQRKLPEALAAATPTVPGIAATTRPATPLADMRYGKLPLSFEANRGQAHYSIKFLARGAGYTLFLTATEATLLLAEPIRPNTRVGKRQVASDALVRLQLVGANPNARVEGVDELPGRSNYFIGKYPAKWRTGVPTYAKVKVEDVYRGVDLVYYGNQGRLEYDFVVAPGADPKVIQFVVEGSRPPNLSERGNLVLSTARGDIHLRRPYLYQQQDGARREVSGGFVRLDKHRIGFEVAAYDNTRPLVIDPTVVYSTYLGGGGDDQGLAIAVDRSGNAYITGSTGSLSFPTANPIRPRLGGSCNNAFVTKLNSAGTGLLYSTYLGGSGCDGGYGIAVDGQGNAYVTGATRSTNFPVTPGALQSTGSVFVTKLNALGSALVYSTYFGSSADDLATGMAVDALGNAHIAGFTRSTTFPTTDGAFQATFGGGTFDAFIAKLNASGTSLIFSTYLGGSGDDFGYGPVVDALGGIYLTGKTKSTNFPRVNAFQTILGSGGLNEDAFVTKLNASGTVLLYSTYLGGSGQDQGRAISVDAIGNAYVTGLAGPGFPTTSGALQRTSTTGGCFASKVNPFGSALIYSTYLTGIDGCLGSGIDGVGNLYVGGSGLLKKLNLTGSALDYSVSVRGVGAVAVDAAGNAFSTGSNSSNLVTTPGAFQTVYGGGNSDAFVVKVSPDNPVPTITGLSPTSASASATAFVLTVTGSSFVVGSLVQWNGSERSTTFVSGTQLTATIPASDSATGGVVQVTVLNPPPGGGPSNALTFTVNNLVPAISSLTPSTAAAGAGGLTLTVNGSAFASGASVRWNGSPRSTTFVSSSRATASIPANDLAAAGTAQVTVFNPGPGGGTSSPRAFVIAASVPAINSGGTVNAASLAPGAVAAGVIASVFGTNLAQGTTSANTTPLPTLLGGVSLLMNGIPAPLLYVSPTQINFQLPWELANQVQASITVTAGGVTSGAVAISLAPFAPGIFSINQSGGGQGAVLIGGTGFVAAPSGSVPGARPVMGGEYISIFCTGLGPVTNPPQSGAVASGSPLSVTTTAPVVAIGGVPATVAFSGLAPGFVGLYQVNVQVPPNAPVGNAVPLVLSIGRVSANAVTIAVQ